MHPVVHVPGDPADMSLNGEIPYRDPEVDVTCRRIRQPVFHKQARRREADALQFFERQLPCKPEGCGTFRKVDFVNLYPGS